MSAFRCCLNKDCWAELKRTAITHCQRNKSHDMSMTSHVTGNVIILRMLTSHKTHTIVHLDQLSNPPVRCALMSRFVSEQFLVGMA